MTEISASASVDFLGIILSVFDRNRHCQRLILCETKSVSLDDMIRSLLKGDISKFHWTMEAVELWDSLTNGLHMQTDEAPILQRFFENSSNEVDTKVYV